MKRAFPQKVKPVPPHAVNDAMAGQSKQVSSDVNRRACTSAAMIGLAISMGASNLLVSGQNEGAIAAEPVATEPTVSTASATHEVSVVSSAPEVESATVAFPASGSSVTEHIVQEGQTLWKIARLYQVDESTIARANSISTDAVLRVGQVLRIPASERSVGAVDRGSTSVAEAPVNRMGAGSPAYYAALPQVEQTDVPVSKVSETDRLKEKQDTSLTLLKQKRTELSNSLQRLKSAESTPFAVAQPGSSQPEAVTLPAPQVSEVTKLTTQSGVTAPTPAVSPVPQQPAAVVPEVEKKSDVVSLALPMVSPAEAPKPEVSEAKSRGVVAYRVRPKDTLDGIARAYGVSRKEILAANRISDPDYIWVDQVLKIPQSSSATAPKRVKQDFANRINTPAPVAVSSVSESAGLPVAVPTLVASATSDKVEPALSAIHLAPATQIQDKAPSLLPNASSEATQREFKGVSAPVSVAAPAALSGTTPAEAKVAVAPLSNAPFTNNSELNQKPQFNPDSSFSPYAQRLRVEILKLREKHRVSETKAAALNQITTSSTATEATVLPLSRPVNPEFSPSKQAASLQAEMRALRENQRAESPVSRKPAATTGQLVAAAPLGADAYDPLIQPLVGKMVSPEMPPLSADKYLPDSRGQFKGYIWPAKGVLTSGYGWRWGRMHQGIDIAADIGTPVVAAAPGVVVYAGWNAGGYGNLVEIEHPDGSFTRYAHNNRILVREGQQVDQGEQIAEMGSTGYSTGPHSHFEVHLPGQGAVNPMAYLPGQGDS